MPRGPHPQPLEKKRALGNPGHQKLPAVGSTHAVERIAPTAPRGLGLGKDGRRLWGHVAALPWVGASDAAALQNLCALADLIATLEADVAERGPAYESRGRWLPNPSVSRLLDARKMLAALSGHFGLTPGDRSRLGIAEVKAQSKLEELAERREARARAAGRAV
jgi:P27 family predicted phage terminase small subunit